MNVAVLAALNMQEIKNAPLALAILLFIVLFFKLLFGTKMGIGSLCLLAAAILAHEASGKKSRKPPAPAPSIKAGGTVETSEGGKATFNFEGPFAALMAVIGLVLLILAFTDKAST